MSAPKPYSSLRIATNYIRYYSRAYTRHDVHSPEVYNFINEVLLQTKATKSKTIENERKRLLASQQTIDFIDFGKQGIVFKKNVADIAKKSLKSKKYAQLIGRIAQYYNSTNILEIGTSLGITTSYIASNENSNITTMEGDPTVAGIAQDIWEKLGYTNINCIVGNVDQTINQLSDKTFNLIYIDGNHRLEPTLRYFDFLKNECSTLDSVFIFDDIHYSTEMEQAWETIKKRDDVKITIDLFFLGIVFINKGLSKQDFTIRF